MAKKFVVWFDEVDKEDIDIVGGKGANLGEMTKAGFPVPPGFIVTAQAYNHFLDVTGLRDNLKGILYNLDVSNSKALESASRQIEKLITRSHFPKEIAEPIQKTYFQMDEGMMKHAFVAVRSSATAEDLPDASFAGQQATFLNVHGEADLIEKVKQAWASLFTARAIFYRATNKFDHFKVSIAVPVQKMISSDVSGIMFTIDPVTNDKSKLTIEAIWGLGEMIVGGSVTPDHYEVDKQTLAITKKEVNVQEKQMLWKNGKNVIEPIGKALASKQKLDDEHIKQFAQLGKKLEKHYFFPQDIEWALDQGTLYVLQTRPVTTTGKEYSSLKTESRKLVALLRGDPASPGMASGPVKILRSPKELSNVTSGDILVAEMTNPDYVPAMRKVVAIVTERGGRTSHAAIVSRELGIPAVVGAAGIMKAVKDGLVITVDGSRGEIYKGALAKPNLTNLSHVANLPNTRIKTATKVYVNLAEPSRAREISKMHTDGVGLLRAEFMIAGIGTHPKKLIKEGKQKQFVSSLADNLEIFCSAFGTRPVVYRATDFKTNEYRSLKGGKEFEPEEPNPMLGYRGAARYIGTPEVFELELEAIKYVRNKLGYKNLWIMIPFVRTPKELLDVKKIVVGAGLDRSSTFKLWMMVEIPTNVIRLEEFLAVGIDGVSIGSNDLTMLLLGTDRDNSDVAHDFSEMDPSVLWAIEHVVKLCHKHQVTSSICGQAPSDYPDLIDKLVRWGITSVSVNPDAVSHVRSTIADAESKL
ncbi:phosphoenolpyruvate synthase [Candidatus Gottesmanbacteria bacterium RIFCSPLOWO2_01_FULL_46_21]|uniref:Phosphoenolpyruvate synthase n=1 Tax=Candidatus Gottesmanbacteria bacterium RIFCSPLOWO2_01_FULL_46_21 TaxID=1798393 RepID=A0A1F6AWV7_9BACT|nr:MAG: phosphoenolpyruvate synthase [Candidatus Gottesmanbacteria bacterium RIFCSPLOWO2_01_FULL_46_21]